MGQGRRPNFGKGRCAMLARVVIYLYFVMLGVAFLIERPLDIVAIGP